MFWTAPFLQDPFGHCQWSNKRCKLQQQLKYVIRYVDVNINVDANIKTVWQ